MINFASVYASLKVLQKAIVLQSDIFIFAIVFYFLLELYWVAPEFLGEDVAVRSSQPGDAYSYGIILSELLSREEPYSSLFMDPRGGYRTPLCSR